MNNELKTAGQRLYLIGHGGHLSGQAFELSFAGQVPASFFASQHYSEQKLTGRHCASFLAWQHDLVLSIEKVFTCMA
jgi:hypothetical protein